MNNGQLMELIINALPYPDQIEDIEFIEVANRNAIRLAWRGTRYEVSGDLNVGELCDMGSTNTVSAILLRELLKRTKMEKELKEDSSI